MASTIQGRFSTKIGRSNTVQSTNNFNDIYNNTSNLDFNLKNRIVRYYLLVVCQLIK